MIRSPTMNVKSFPAANIVKHFALIYQQFLQMEKPAKRTDLHADVGRYDSSSYCPYLSSTQYIDRLTNTTAAINEVHLKVVKCSSTSYV